MFPTLRDVWFCKLFVKQLQILKREHFKCFTTFSILQPLAKIRHKYTKVDNAGWKEKEFYGLIIPHSRQPNRDFQGPFSLMLADEPNN